MSEQTKPRRRLIEARRRRDGFDPADGSSVPVRLADGWEWYIPRPMMEIVPIFEGGKAVDSARGITCGPEIDVLLEAIAAETNHVRQVLAVLTLGAFLLQRNYDLSDDELRRLLVFRPGDEASESMLRGIVEVATGKLNALFGRGALSDPKGRAAGSGSP
ncbi:hypothetical protein [Paludisphaera rhizosphaerae]|uniref:hypothetical protein n=1 Tax=Paludisphaera rhizosphaerae TaxID=2711216 RepID=UPI0013EC8162|nr:hypothetical protein [Paludisphaera rhizosphaerae]